jgi:soluble lytic murein transglycosylase
MRRFGWAAGLAFVVLGAQAAPADEAFLAAREAFRTGNAAKLDAYARRLQGHVLEPYVAYWQLRMRLAEAAPERVRAFLAAHADSAVSEQLRAEWLKHLGKTGQWELFREELALLERPDLEITCYALQVQLAAGHGEALRDARALWFIGRELPESCAPLVRALTERGAIGVEEVWMRVRSLLEAGNVSAALRTAAHLPEGQRPDAKALAAAYSNPAGYLRGNALDLGRRGGREAVLFAVQRLARLSPEQAAEQWVRLEPRFTEEERRYAWGMIAYLGAMRHSPQALEWYARAGDLSDLQLAWKARAALRAGDWREVLAAIEAMTEREKQDPAWRYWKARALKALGRPKEAAVLLRALAPEFHFYGQLALEELGGAVDVPAAGFVPGEEDVRAMRERPGLRRALELYRLGLRVEGSREWAWAIRGFEDRELLAAAELARRFGLYDRAIGTAERTVEVHDFGLRYLAPYREVLKPHLSRLELDEAWVYGLIRQESRFVADARSRAGASGLMQLMPATARWVAKKIGLRNWRWSQVTDVDVNVALGTYYLRHVLDKLDGHAVLASAAYNAGPGRARAWRPAQALEGAVYAETIPLNETRDYVKKVLANATYYAHLFAGRLQPLRERLGVIGPRDPAHESPLEDTP